jgi:hypothetical protein
VKNLLDKLHQHYLQLRDDLIQQLPKNILFTAYEQLSRKCLSAMEIKEGEKDSEDRVLRVHPFQLASAAHAARTAAEQLCKAADIVYPKLTFLRSVTANHLEAVANEDEWAVHRELVRFRRAERKVLSPWGFLFKMLPAWPLLTGIFIAVSQWPLLVILFQDVSEWGDRSWAMLALFILSGIATWEYANEHQALKKIWRTRREKIEQEIVGQGTVLRLMSKVLHDYRLIIVSRLKQIACVLEDLVKLLRTESASCLERIGQIENRFSESRVSKRGSIYWLADKSVCDEWASQALDDIQQAQGMYRILQALIPGIIAEQIFPKERPPSHWRVYSAIDTLVRNAITIVSNAKLEYKKNLAHEKWEEELDRVNPIASTGSLPDAALQEKVLRTITRSDALNELINIDLARICVELGKQEESSCPEPIYASFARSTFEPVSALRNLDFSQYNELDLCILRENEEDLMSGAMWQWLIRRSQPLGGGEKTKSFVFLTTASDAVWDVTTSGKNNPFWREEFQIIHSRTPNEVGCIQALVEFRQ